MAFACPRIIVAIHSRTERLPVQNPKLENALSNAPTAFTWSANIRCCSNAELHTLAVAGVNASSERRWKKTPFEVPADARTPATSHSRTARAAGESPGFLSRTARDGRKYWPIVASTEPVRLRAGDRTRTGDIQLGKLALYQLSYARISSHHSVYRPATLLQAAATLPHAHLPASPLSWGWPSHRPADFLHLESSAGFSADNERSGPTATQAMCRSRQPRLPNERKTDFLRLTAGLVRPYRTPES